MTKILLDISHALTHGSSVVIYDDVSATESAFFVSDGAQISPHDISHLVNCGRGIFLAAMWEQDLRSLGLPPMASSTPSANLANDGALTNLMTVSVDARHGITTGISASDRALTLQALAKTQDPKLDLVMPGHIFPIRARQGGVLVRPGIAEAALDLLNLSQNGKSSSVGIRSVAAVMQCLNEQGELLSQEHSRVLAAQLELPWIAVTDIVRFRLQQEQIVDKIAESRLPTMFGGLFRAVVFRSSIDNSEHLALIKGDVVQDPNGSDAILTRVQAERPFEDLIGVGSSPNSRELLQGALSAIENAERGVFLYLRHPRQGAIARELNSIAGQPQPKPAMDLREYGLGAQILSQLGLRRIALLTNSNRDIPGLDAFHLEITERVPLQPSSNERAPSLQL